jgi:hypothetical protein
MVSKDELIAEIVEHEWKMMQNVNNIGGKSDCQQDTQTFKAMRISQAVSWSEATLESYLNDLKDAEKNNRNLLSEKYARMMKSTSPLDYARIAKLLPPIDDETNSFIDKIAEIELEWEEDIAKNYPYVIQRGRPLRSSEDSMYGTSLETYLRGELASYSKKTLKLHCENRGQQKSANINGNKMAYEAMVKAYGYPSLEEANELLKKNAEKGY